MVNVFSILNMGVRSLAAQQTAVNVVGHNIANINTPNYTRQQAMLSPSSPNQYGLMQIGTGADVTSIVQFRDEYALSKVNLHKGLLAYSSKKHSLLSEIEQSLVSPNAQHLGEALTELWQGFEGVGNSPDGAPERQNLAQTGQRLAQSIRTQYAMLRGQRSFLNDEIAQIVERALIGSIRRHTQTFTGVLSDMSNWPWYLQDFEGKGTGKARKVNPYTIQTLTRNQRLLVVPDGVINEKGEAYASAADNWLNAKRGGGFLYYTKERLNKNRRFNNFYYCKVGGSEKYALPGEVGGTKTREPTTKCLVIRPRLKKRSRRAR